MSEHSLGHLLTLLEVEPHASHSNGQRQARFPQQGWARLISGHLDSLSEFGELAFPLDLSKVSRQH